MAVGFLFLIIVVVAVVFICLVALSAFRSTDSERDLRADNRELKSELANTRAQRKVGEKALRQIASGTSGNPTAEAQYALDEIDNYYSKELEA